MKTLTSVLLVLAAAATPAFADSAYFLRPATPAVSAQSINPVNRAPVITDRVSVQYRAKPTVRAVRPEPAATVRVKPLFMRGAGQAAIVR